MIPFLSQVTLLKLPHWAGPFFILLSLTLCSGDHLCQLWTFCVSGISSLSLISLKQGESLALIGSKYIDVEIEHLGYSPRLLLMLFDFSLLSCYYFLLLVGASLALRQTCYCVCFERTDGTEWPLSLWFGNCCLFLTLSSFGFWLSCFSAFIFKSLVVF